MTSHASAVSPPTRAVQHQAFRLFLLIRRSILFFFIVFVSLALFVPLQSSSRTSALRLPTAERSLSRVTAYPVKPAAGKSFANYPERGATANSLLLITHAPVFSGSPYTGAAFSLPGRIEAENFDNGGEGVAYHDTTVTNDGGYYRSESVDVCTCGSPYGLSVGWTQAGEWMEYTVSVASYGSYKFQTLTATISSGSALHIEVDGVNVTGQMIVPNTGAWGSYATTSSPAVALPAGQHIVRVAIDVGGFLIDSVDVIRLNTPYGGTAINLPGTVQAENFDNGGEGVAYHDTTSTNEGGAYRSEGVDLCGCSAPNSVALGWSQVGEWTKYTVNVSNSDTYTLQATVSTIGPGCTIHLEVDGVNVTGPMVLPNTGAWGNYQTVSKPNVSISSGTHELKMVIETGGFLMDALNAIPSVPSGPSALTANAVSISQINLAWTDNSFNESGFKIERKTGPSGTYAQIASTAANATSFSNTGLQPGTQYFYRIRATNLGGDSAFSNESSAITANLLPSVAVTSPATGTVFTAPANITINATAADSDGTVSKVEFFEGSNKLGEDLSAPYSFNWTGVSAGTYSVTAKAIDNLGGISMSAAVAITVNAPPTISITGPTANTVVHSPVSVTITASASDTDGTVAKVEFFQNGTLLGEDTTAPYNYVWTNAPVGTFSLTARATDNRNATTTSGAVTLIVNNPPSVSINAPAPSSTFVAGSTISITATSSDTDGTISKVEFYQGSTKLGEDAVSPFTFNWANVQLGTYSLSAVAIDDRGASKTSSAVLITVVGNSMPRLDPMNRMGGGGEDPLSRNFNWTLPLVNLPGRAGMDLSLSLSYNSLVWTKLAGNSISFDDDRGFPSPGFRLGFPVIQPLYYNSEVGKDAYLLIGNDGSHTELRRVGTSGLFESADSSHLLLDTNTMILRTTDGTQLSYALQDGEYKCTQIKDRNGNYITVTYVSGNLSTITDTLGRVINFNYENGWLASITQVWDASPAPPHYWARFEYADKLIDTNFPGMTVHGPQDGSYIKTLTRVKLADDSRFDFDYTSWGQVSQVNAYAPNNDLLNYRKYNLPEAAAQDDCPRFTQRYDWARYWNGDTEGTPADSERAVTQFAIPVSDTWTMPGGTSPVGGMRAQVTAPDGTSNKIYFLNANGWQRGLPALVDTYSSGSSVPVRRSMTTWTQDNTTVSYPLNPHVTETNIYDDANNRARTEVVYQHFDFSNGTNCDLPQVVNEYAADASTILRSTKTVYKMDADYTDLRILGLVSERSLYEGVVDAGTLMAKVAFFYDESGSILGNDAPVQHATNYNSSFIYRGNVSSAKRYDVTNTNVFTTTSSKYNTAGSVVSATDAENHTVAISYADSFSDGVARTTLAYPTKVTDPDNYFSTTKYNFNFGAITRRQTPRPNTTDPNDNQPRPEQSWTFDSIGRLQQITNLVNNAYTRFEYATSGVRVDTYTTIKDTSTEAHSFKFTDGAGRVIATAADHNTNTFSGQKVVYDVMGRVIKTSNPTETSASGLPSQWDTTGDDEDTGWIYTEQTYDWKGRSLVTTNQDGTTKTASYSGCGCAGGEVLTLTDAGTIDAGVAKRRQQRIYSDVLGRTVKIEILNWQNGSVYSATVNTYNARDQVKQVRQYVGTEGSPTYQDTTMTYDGFGRLKTQHRPEQQIDAYSTGTTDHTTWDYNADDTVQKMTDPRGATATYTYNARQLVTSITYAASAPIPGTPQVSLAYDGAGNRTSLTDGTGSTAYEYDQLSRMKSETRTFTGLTGSYTLTYAYNLANQLTSLSLPTWSQVVGYNYDSAGRLAAVTASGFSTWTYNWQTGQTTYTPLANFASNLNYRAWGGIKHIDYGNGAVLNQQYNQRLQISNADFTQAGSTRTTSYDYYADGRVHHAYDSNANVYDRAYEYDHVGRLKQAYSGAQARGGTTNDGPYWQSYGYDALGNLTNRTNYFWAHLLPGDAATYTDNRRTDYSYDAAGNILGDSGDHTYDAAGNQTESSTMYVSSLTTVYLTQTYDGDGRPAKRTEHRIIEQESGPPEEEWITNYFLRSSVLNGAPIVDLTGYGMKEKLRVYAAGTVLAEEGSLIVGGVQWRYPKPGTGSWIDSNGGGHEMDPLGADVSENPYLVYQTPSYLNLKENGERLFDEGDDPFSVGSGCSLDGMPVSCSYLNRRLDDGSVQSQYFGLYERDPNLPAGAPTRFVPVTKDIKNHGLGIYEIWMPPEFRNEYSRGGWVLLPQNPGEDIRPQNLLSHIFTLLDDNRCSTFVSNLINVARQLTGKTPFTYDGKELALAVANQPNGGIFVFSGARGGGGGGTAGGDIFRGEAEANFTMFNTAYGPRDSVGVQYTYALVALHELIHLAGGGEFGYIDVDLAAAAKILTDAPGYPVGNDPNLPLWQITAKMTEAAGNYWDKQLQEHCQPQRQVYDRTEALKRRQGLR
jgi:YD repeat-containing protein